MANLYLMCGIPGSGKSTWLKNHLKKFDKYVSRDEIRFSMVKENEEYFSKENEVFKEFCHQITKNLKNGYNTFADATNLNPKARKKLISNVSGYDELYIIVLETPLQIALKRNAMRTGRSFVPESAIRNMYNSFEFPKIKEGFKTIYVITDNNPIKIIKEDF